MKKYINDYILKVEKSLKDKNISKIDDFELKISFFQHERLVHLLITLFFAFISIVFFGFTYFNIYFSILFLISIILLIFYVLHYFFLENSVQYLYKLYDEYKTIIKK